jgi:hypothetical protein
VLYDCASKGIIPHEWQEVSCVLTSC